MKLGEFGLAEDVEKRRSELSEPESYECVMASALLQLVEDGVHVNFSTSQTRLSCQWDKMESYRQLKQKRLLLKRLKAKYSTPPRPWSGKAEANLNYKPPMSAAKALEQFVADEPLLITTIAFLPPSPPRKPNLRQGIEKRRGISKNSPSTYNNRPCRSLDFWRSYHLLSPLTPAKLIVPLHLIPCTSAKSAGSQRRRPGITSPVLLAHRSPKQKQLYVFDPKALHHILVKDQYVYEETSVFIQ
ncbi:uncharacterized protein LACBIDRAFT_329726 [Laccaria bicolor S238N-H82]|uniref:Predicted protein n=1 Tax=Laccaria bicolor (strain S238N-H82 / ATCC MYA-4686) TaxID=486041 RepID=B0DJ14_LACBS|nr:uncharacterized protein LACBIDRAFT_329726 [Laccaria bicolor S238N-H82]EDR05441.1 predicted protein [Laccaria bicolor S238N-H82]|eukprot:XP_001883999.1 predicted protein [Laccaria bicolor S238N-H82]